ncbi:hypothetical protein AALO_G00032670 [Alosa alosa]|uniref:Uncharacterized protein n=1 Tax=Alosa alosa TaxID=278164 RepID=A0AAV6HGI8_9TELE|nr:hypothetical protein AALO_G00032670 [Alosa alosa]
MTPPSAIPQCLSALGVSPEELIDEIWSGKRQGVLWSKVGPYKIFSRDLSNLAPGKEVESEVMNAFIQCSLEKVRGQLDKKAFYVDSNVFWNVVPNDCCMARVIQGTK